MPPMDFSFSGNCFLLFYLCIVLAFGLLPGGIVRADFNCFFALNSIWLVEIGSIATKFSGPE
jgi:hypothetical protein